MSAATKLGPPPTWNGLTNMEYAAPGLTAWAQEAWKEIAQLRTLGAEIARLVCVEDVPYVDDKEAHRALDLAANEIGYLLKLPEPEFANLWREDDTLGVCRGA